MSLNWWLFGVEITLRSVIIHADKFMLKFCRIILRLFLLALLLAFVGGGICLWNYVNDMTQPILSPLNEQYEGLELIPPNPQGLQLAPFSFKGADGVEITAVIATRAGEESTRQLMIMSQLGSRSLSGLREIDYVLICVDWDHGIQSALPMAETLTAAGLRCVLWEPRGKDLVRPYCTHGLTEHHDVSLLINALSQGHGSKEPFIVAVGQGFGAVTFLQAISGERRLRGLVAIDSFCSLRESVNRILPDSKLKKGLMWFIDQRTSRLAGYECFDIAPAESASYIDPDTPILLMSLEGNGGVSLLEDSINIYRQSPSLYKSLWTLRGASDSSKTAYRQVEFKRGKDELQRSESLEIRLLDDVDHALMQMIIWMNDDVIEAARAPRAPKLPRPNLSQPQTTRHE